MRAKNTGDKFSPSHIFAGIGFNALIAQICVF